MPYIVVEENDEFCVYRQGEDEQPTGDSLGCHKTQEEAGAQIAAIEEEEAKSRRKMYGGLAQDAVGYVTVSPQTGTQQCANCTWFRPGAIEWEGAVPADLCHIVNSWPEPILPTGGCQRWETKPPTPEVMGMTPMPVVIVEPEEVEIEMSRKSGWRDWLRGWLKTKDSDQDFRVFKGVDGDWWWVARYTNNFKDLEGEIISEKALDEYVERVDAGLVPPPELWCWHTPGTKHGQGETVFRQGHFTYAAGRFDRDADHARQYYQKHRVELSHGFTTPAWAFKEGVYEVVNTFEVTTLPVPGTAANPFTDLEVTRAMNLANDPQKRQALEAVLGKDKVDALIADAEKHGKALEELGVKYKNFTQVQVKKEPSTLDMQAVAALLLDLVETQGQMLAVQQAAEKKSTDDLTQRDETIKALIKQVSELAAIVKAGPRAAHEDVATELTAEELAEVQSTVKQAEDDAEAFKAFWRVAKKEEV